jgi:hypothetical protein
LKGARQGWTTTDAIHATRFLREGAKVLLRRLQALAIDDDDGPTRIRMMTVPPNHLCCHAAAQMVASGSGRGTTVARNNQQPTREQEGCRERREAKAQQEATMPETRQRHWQTQVVRGSGGKNVIFSNTPQTTSECFKLLYYVPI